MSKHRVAIIVFCEVECESELDAETMAQRAIWERLIKPGGDISTDGFGRRWIVRAGRVMEAGLAIGNGYLWTTVTPKAFREGSF